MNRLDKFEDILDSYDERNSSDNALDRFLLVVNYDGSERQQMFFKNGGACALKESCAYTAEQAALCYKNGKAKFSGWHSYDDNDTGAVQIYTPFTQNEVEYDLRLEEAMNKALSKGNIAVLSVSKGLTPKKVLKLLKKHHDSGNTVALIEISSIWAAGYDGPGFGIHRKTGGSIGISDLMRGYVKHIYNGDPEP